MFERDKEDLRELGMPLETGVNHPSTRSPATGSGSRPMSCPSSS